MNQESNILDYKFGLESLDSTRPSELSKDIKAPELTATTVTAAGTRKQRVGPAKAATEETNELVAAFTNSGSDIPAYRSESSEPPIRVPNVLSPSAVATPTQTRTPQAVLPSVMTLPPVTESQNQFRPFALPSSQMHFSSESTQALEGSVRHSPLSHSTFTPTTTPADECARADRLQEARAIFSIRRGIKVFAVLGAVLVGVLIYETTKQSMFTALADTAVSLHMAPAALQIFDAQLSKSKSAPSLLTNWAEKEQSRSHFQFAAQCYTKAIAIQPDNYLHYLNRGAANLQLHQPKLTIIDENKAIALKPDAGLAYNYRGLAYKAEGNLNQAVSDFNKGITVSTSQPKSVLWLNRGAVYLQTHHYKEAIQDFDTAIKHGSDQAQGWKNKALAEMQHEHKAESKAHGHHHHRTAL